jgi:hypothetical protein
MAQAVSRKPSRLKPGFDPRPGHVGFVVDRIAPGRSYIL